MTVLPPIGLGTSQNTDPTVCTRTVTTAIEMGYRHVDTAQMYQNERYVGKAIDRSSVDRDDVVVATKIDENDYSYERVLATADESRRRLGVDTIDLLYVHWPTTNYDPHETLPAFDELRDEGVIGDVGVSNFDAEQVTAAIDVLDAPLVANQIEMHPLLAPPEPLLESARMHGFQLVAYSPFCRTDAFGLDPIVAVAEKHGVSQAQAILAWLLTFDEIVVIPKGTGEKHLRENLGALTVDLDEEDVARIDAIEERKRLIDRVGAPWNL